MDKQGYYYLDSKGCNPRGYVNFSLLKNDLNRGVKRLPEYAYVEGWGSTQGSLRFFHALNSLISLKAKRATMVYTQRHHYTLTVFTEDGLRVVFKGLGSGYFGEGSRGCYDVLKALGFNQKQCENVFEKENFLIIKRR